MRSCWWIGALELNVLRRLVPGLTDLLLLVGSSRGQSDLWGSAQAP